MYSDMTDTGDDCSFDNPECYAKFCHPNEPMCKAIAEGCRCKIPIQHTPCWREFLGVDCTGETYAQCFTNFINAVVDLGLKDEVEGQECIGITRDGNCFEMVTREECDPYDPSCDKFVPE